MKWNFFRKNREKKEQKPKTFFQEWRDALVFAVVVATLIRWSAVEAFVVPTPSMENTILTGDYLFVSKLHYGARTPRTPLQIPLTHQKIWGTEIPSYLPWIQLPSFRLPSLTTVKQGDVVVFNIPGRAENDGFDRPIDLKTFYVKRCTAIAGDELMITNGQVMVNGKPLADATDLKYGYHVTAKEEIRTRNLANLGVGNDDYKFLGRTANDRVVYKMLLTAGQFRQLQSAPYVVDVTAIRTARTGGEYNIFPSSKRHVWNGDKYGPLIIPAKGMTIDINDSTLALYGETIRLYEHHNRVEEGKSTLTINGQAASQYTFTQNYYFMMGDNRHNSHDSRYWGFVPEDHIVGKPLFIAFSKDNEAGFFNAIRWTRMFTIIR